MNGHVFICFFSFKMYCPPDNICVSGKQSETSCPCLAGLAIGIKLLKLPWAVVGITLAGSLEYYQQQQRCLQTGFQSSFGEDVRKIHRHSGICKTAFSRDEAAWASQETLFISAMIMICDFEAPQAGQDHEFKA